MKLFLIGLVTAIAVVGLSACGGSSNDDNLGYPKRLEIPKEGGELQVKGDWYVDIFEIADEEGGGTICVYFESIGSDSIKARITSRENSMTTWGTDTVVGVNDSIQIHFKWLKACRLYKGHDFVLQAEPNLTGKNRKLLVTGCIGPDDMDVWVEQKGK